MAENRTKRIRVGHSPDPDDAFMFYGIAAEKVDTGIYRIEQVLEDIESLNRRCLAGELEVSAVSVHAWAHLADRYALMDCGASMGDGYGPCVVSKQRLAPGDLTGATIGIPGTLTSAYLALRLCLDRGFEYKVIPFDQIPAAVIAGDVDAGLLIHEGQLTWAEQGFHHVIDLGQWWGKHTGGLPLPLGANAVRRDLGDATMLALTRILRESIAYGLAHRAEALAYAKDFGRGLDDKLTDRFVGMYVNDLTRDYGDRGREAIRRFLDEGACRDLVPRVGEIAFVG